jgi:hypothetical protein
MTYNVIIVDKKNLPCPVAGGLSLKDANAIRDEWIAKGFNAVVYGPVK